MGSGERGFERKIKKKIAFFRLSLVCLEEKKSQKKKKRKVMSAEGKRRVKGRDRGEAEKQKKGGDLTPTVHLLSKFAAPALLLHP